MFEHQERTAILILIGVAVVVIAGHLALSMLGKQPFAKPFSENSADGELVVMDGKIDQVSVIQNGGHLLLHVNNVSVFVPAQVADGLKTRSGDSVRLFGTVQTYRGKKEIILASKDDIQLLP